MKQEKVYKYSEYIKENTGENMNLQAQSYVESALKKLKERLESMFDYEKKQEEIPEKEEKVKNFDEVQDEERRKEGKLSFMDMGVNLESLELSKYSKNYDNVKLIFSDENFRYDLTFTINLADAVSKNNKEDFSADKIENCQILFKKYDRDNFELKIGPCNKTAKLKDINEEFLINLKIEFEKEFENPDEKEFEIETFENVRFRTRRK